MRSRDQASAKERRHLDWESDPLVHRLDRPEEHKGEDREPVSESDQASDQGQEPESESVLELVERHSDSRVPDTKNQGTHGDIDIDSQASPEPSRLLEHHPTAN